ELGDGPERGQKEGAVQAEDRDRYAGRDALPAQDVGETVHRLVVRAVGDRLVLEAERDPIGNLLCLLADQGTEGIDRPLELLEYGAEVDAIHAVAPTSGSRRARAGRGVDRQPDHQRGTPVL